MPHAASVPTRVARRSLLAAVALITLMGSTACLAPKYERPDYKPPAEWRTPAAETAATADLAWWELFDDPVLTELIQAALKEGTDPKIAAARVEAALGQLSQVRSAFFPQVGYGGSVGRGHQSSAGPGAAPAPGEDVYDSYQAALGASWELDLFGRIRNQSEATRNRVLATEEAQRGTILTLVSQVANSYIQLRDYDRQLEISRQTAYVQGESLHILMLQYQAGVISEVPVSQARSQFERAMAAVPEYERLVGLTENNLNVLLGRNPGPIPRGKPIVDLIPPPIPEGLPSSVLERRPDVRQAEYELIAANADIGAARAAFFPTIALTGLLGSLSGSASDLFHNAAYTWNAAAGIAGPIFRGGALRGNLRVAEATQKEALARYQRAVQNAFADANTSITSVQKYREQSEARKRQVEALQTYSNHARASYEAGQSAYLEVLTADQYLFDAQLAHARLQGEAVQAVVATYASLGGGWVDLALQASKPAEDPNTTAQKK